MYIVLLCLSTLYCQPIEPPTPNLAECKKHAVIEARVPKGTTADPNARVICAKQTPTWTVVP